MYVDVISFYKMYVNVISFDNFLTYDVIQQNEVLRKIFDKTYCVMRPDKMLLDLT